MLGKGLESLIPAGGYQKSDDSSLQNYSEPSQQAQSSQALGAYTELVSQNSNYAGIITNSGAGEPILTPQSMQSLQDIDMSPINPSTQTISTPTVQLIQPTVSQPQAIESPQLIAEEQFVFTPQTTQTSEIIPISEIKQVLQVTPVSQDAPFSQNASVLQSTTPLQPVILPQALQNEPVLELTQLQPMISLQSSQNIPVLQSMSPQSVDLSQTLQSTPIAQSITSPQPLFMSPIEPIASNNFVSQTVSAQTNNSPENTPFSHSPIITYPQISTSQDVLSSQTTALPQTNLPQIEHTLPSLPMRPIVHTSQTTDIVHNFTDNNLSPVNPVLQDNLEEDYSRKQASVFQIEVERIFPNPHQPRRYFDEDALGELANSIREFGIIQPLIVTKILKETEGGTDVSYQLIAGERRLMAAKKVGLRTVPVVIRHVGIDRERLELAIIENVQRENLNPLEAARGYARLQDEFRLTQREIATRIGKSRETVANTLRLLHLPSEIQQALEKGIINESHARLLLQIDDISRQKDMFQSILRTKPSVRDLKAIIRRAKTGLATHYLSPELISLQSRLEEFLGTKTQIDDNGGKGKITINYYSPEELNALINRLSGEDF